MNPPRYSEADLLQTFLINHSSDTIILAASGDAEEKLSYLCKKQMMMCGSNIPGMNVVVLDDSGDVKVEAVFPTGR